MISKGQGWALLLFNVAYLMGATLYYILHWNAEFMLYVGAVMILFVLFILLQRRIQLPLFVLWMLSIWGLLHMLGGSLPIGDAKLYSWVPFELYNAHDAAGELVLLKFDQIMHFYIYLVVSFILAWSLRKVTRTFSFSFAVILIALASTGVGVLNELIEFAAVLLFPETGVGGYYNTLLDLCFNTAGALVGALIALYLWRGTRSR